MKRILITLTLLLTIGSMSAQTLKSLFNRTRWTDGDAFYLAELKGLDINFSGGNLHEGGYCFGLHCTNAKALTFTVQEGTFEGGGSYISINAHKGTSVTLKTIGKDVFLVMRDKRGNVLHTMRQMKGSFSNLRTIQTDQWRQCFEGKYKDVNMSETAYRNLKPGADGDYRITADSLILGRYGKDAYEVMTIYEMPTNIFKMKRSGRLFRISYSRPGDNMLGGVHIYEVTGDSEEEMYEDSLRILSLERRPDGYEGARWAKACSTILLPSQVTSLTRNMAKLMRNEMFATKGYAFSTGDIQAYFSAQRWYHQRPDGDNSQVVLNEVEQINVSLIKSLETNGDIWFATEEEE